MDIPASDTKSSDEGTQKVPVTVAASRPDVARGNQATPKQADAVSSADIRNKTIAELIGSKKYALSIKEKRSAPLITLGLSRSRDRKTHRSTRQALRSSVKKSRPKKIESKKAKTIKLAVIGVLWVGAYLAIDAGLIDIGWRPPFSIIGGKNDAGAEVLQIPVGGGQ